MPGASAHPGGEALAGGAQPITDDARVFYTGHSSGPGLVQAFRCSRVVFAGLEGPTRILTVERGGLTWLPVFTDRQQLVAFHQARAAAGTSTVVGEAGVVGGLVWVGALGARVLDFYLPALGSPVGVMVDPLSQYPVALPPLQGLVPESVALDAEHRGQGASGFASGRKWG